MRRSTRIRWRIPVQVTSLDPSLAVVERCETIVVNFHGCAVKSGCKFPAGTPVQLHVRGQVVIGRIVEAVSLSARENRWMVGIVLDQPANCWGVEEPPSDWKQAPDPAPASPVASDKPLPAESATEKFAFWPSALGPAPQTSPVPPPQSPAVMVAPAAPHAKIPELEKELAACREERALVETIKQELTSLPHEVDSKLNDVAAALRSEIVPLREQLIEQARKQLQQVVMELQEKAAAQWTAREQTASSTTMRLEEIRNDCLRVMSQIQCKVDEDQRAREALRPQTEDILQARTALEALLRQYQAEQASAQQAIREQADRACQARQAVEALVSTLSGRIAPQIEERSQAMPQQLREELAGHVSAQVRAALEEVETHARRVLAEGRQDFRQELAQEFESHAKQLRDVSAVRLSELQAVESRLHECVGKCSETMAAESKRGAALAQEELQKLTAEQQARIERAGTEGLEALRTVAGNLLTSMHHELLNNLAREQGKAQQLAEAKIHRLLAEGQQTASTTLQQTAADILDSMRQAILTTFEERQQSFQTAQSAATAQLRQLEKRTDELTAIVDVELQKHTDEIVRESVAQITRQLQQVSESVRAGHIGMLQEEVERTLGVVRQQAEVACAQSREVLEDLQQERAAGETARAQLQGAMQAAQAWLDRETQQFQQTVHDAFLNAAGEIRGRIYQAVEMASEPVERRSREVRDEIAAMAREQVENLHEQAEMARRQLQSRCQESESAAQIAIERHATETLDDFRQGLQRLAQNSMDRWQSALTDTLAAIPQVLAAKLAPSTSTEPAPGGAAQHHSGEKDGGTQGV